MDEPRLLARHRRGGDGRARDGGESERLPGRAFGRHGLHRATAFGTSIGVCTAPSCDGTPRIVDASIPSPAFPTLGGAAGGYEVVLAEGVAHLDVTTAEDSPANAIPTALVDFLQRNVQ